MLIPHQKTDLLIVGAGCVGAIVARLAAEQGMSVLLLERRTHIAGNCQDIFHESGIQIHRYGPHLFRTEDEALVRFLSRFTDWIPSRHFVKARIGGKLFPMPINLTTLELFFQRTFSGEEEARAFVESKRIPIENPRNSEELVLSMIGMELYEAFYRGYTTKQWGRPPHELSASVCARVPIRFTREEHYTEKRYKLLPAQGYTRMFGRILDHPKIQILLSTDYLKLREKFKPGFGIIFTGRLDEYFDFIHGPLQWRSLRFEYKTMFMEFAQPCMQISYPNEQAYTRSVEYKHVTGQKSPHTLVCYEYPQAGGEPFYPVPTITNPTLDQYKNLARQEQKMKRVYFAGRLAEYRYLDMDQAFLRGFQVYEELVRGKDQYNR